MSLKSAIKNLKGRGLFSCIDIHFADFIEKISGKTANDELYLATALLSNVSNQQQHVCLDLQPEHAYSDLSDFFADFSWMKETERKKTEELLRNIKIPANWLEKIIDCRVISVCGKNNAELMPLVLEDTRLYLQRYWKYEKQLAKQIKQRAARKSNNTYLQNFSGKIGPVSKLFSTNDDNINWQVVAAFAAINNNFTVITGGPGTGKTTVVTAIIALLLQDNPNLKISLCAPTGKAQARLQETIVAETAKLNCDQQVITAVSELRTSTIHRLLGVRKNTPFFWKDSDNRLDTDLLIVDEVSMVSQPLMAKLLMAVPDNARIILLGDKDQLASVEIGSILGDICEASELNRFSQDFVDNFAEITGTGPGHLPVSKSTNILVDCAVELQKSHRFHPDRGISQLKNAVNAGDTDKAWQIISSDPSGEINWQNLPENDNSILRLKLSEYLKNLPIDSNSLSNKPGNIANRKYCDYGNIQGDNKEEEIDIAYRLFRESVILCSHRSGIYGVENINMLIREIMSMTRNYCRGLPIMITRNNYQLNLYNGDVGLCWPDEEGVIKVYFPNPGFTDGSTEPRYRSYSPPQLPEHEVVFAMTIHKSQGSGFQQVLIILPDKYSQLLTSELIYTGITRAKSNIVIWADKNIFSRAVSMRIRRSSGLREELLK